MNKTFCKKSKFIYFLFAGCLILFNVTFVLTGCGLDTFYVIDSPSVYHEPLYSSMELPERYFGFSTNEHDYEGTIKFLGTEVYYKIYNSSSKMNSEVSSINSSANNETTANQSANRLIETYKYQALRHSNDEGATILIPKTGNSRRVEIRLANDPEYDAEFTIANNTLGYPVRNITGNKIEDKSFSFKELSSVNHPKSGDNGDADYEYSSTTEEIKEYYVSMFAVSIAQDDNYSSVYSTAIYLGSVTISLE